VNIQNTKILKYTYKRADKKSNMQTIDDPITNYRIGQNIQQSYYSHDSYLKARDESLLNIYTRARSSLIIGLILYVLMLGFEILIHGHVGWYMCILPCMSIIALACGQYYKFKLKSLSKKQSFRL
jgi:hypothetical protein